MSSTIKVAAIQAEPCWNDLKGSVAKTIRLIQEAAGNGAKVVGFPEIFIPGYPWTIWANSPVSNAGFMNEYFHNSLEKESDEMEEIKAAVREAGVFVVLGYSERYRGSLYISQSFIDENGTIVGHRRKIKPTHVERAYWGDGQAESLKAVVPSSFGNIGGLNCWEHTQPLLRYYQYSQNLDIQVSSWPLCWDPLEGQPWPYHLTPPACNRFSQVMAMEGACFVLVCSQVLTEAGKASTRLEDFDYARCPGGGFSMIYGPDGSELCKPLEPGEEGILYANVDLKMRGMMQQNLDLVGHYSRPDLLSLRVQTEAAVPVEMKKASD
ncbi:Nitrilase [Fusarium oligoseptatum]|uniref:nitrilase n=1 Tax=Fusarium oligoseptatum TaxID=2604345 RepID=A0A428TQR4_9HYPO|nr:Nitrilase [Fusarium oligoseptatum]